MTRLLLCACFVLLMCDSLQAQAWTTIKGQVILKKAPDPEKLNVTLDQAHCLSKGPIKSDLFVVNEKNNGFKNVWVYLRPDETNLLAKFEKTKIHPDLAKPKSQEHVIDQPCCMFIPRILALREGDTLVVTNKAPVAHNFNFSLDEFSTNTAMQAGESLKLPQPLKAYRNPGKFKCNIHPWMGGSLMVFDHPYYALTDADGKFEINNAPQGKFRIVYRHEEGFHQGRNGNAGFPIDIAGPMMELKPLEFVFVKK